ncbi:MAG: hypothetical protein AAGF99_02080 [Bacteroidota bacterium]
MLPKLPAVLRHFRPLQALRCVAAWPGRRLVALLAVSLPPLDLSAGDVDRELRRRNVRCRIAPEVHALTQSLWLN